MLEDCIIPYKFCNNYLDSQLKSIKEADADHVPSEGVKPPRWIVGHLAVTLAGIGNLMGQQFCPDVQRRWQLYYSPGSDSTRVHEKAPTLETLQNCILGCEDAVIEALMAADRTDYEDPHGIEFLKNLPFKSKADLIAHLMTTHYCFHLGELAIWRRAMGVPVIF